MNIDPSSARSATTPPPAPAEWTMDVEHDGSCHVGVVKCFSVVMCRILLAGKPGSDQTIRGLLAVKARAWIAGYIGRSHFGATEGTDLQAPEDTRSEPGDEPPARFEIAPVFWSMCRLFEAMAAAALAALCAPPRAAWSTQRRGDAASI